MFDLNYHFFLISSSVLNCINITIRKNSINGIADIIYLFSSFINLLDSSWMVWFCSWI